MVVVFIIDTGASMARSCTGSFSCLDVAKCAVEVFVKQCILAGKGNETFALVDARDDESCMKCIIGDPYSTFEDAYKSLQADSESSLNYAISAAFAMLNQHRVKDGIETIGQGRIPWLLQPATCVLLTDGACFRGNNELALSKSSHAFAELVKEPFRWDQRLFTVLVQAAEDVDLEPPASLVNLCEMTGGDVFACQSLKGLASLMKTIVGKVQQSKVIVCASHDINAPFNTKECMAEMNVKSQGHWPLPEGYWLDRSIDQLPMRTAHPRFVYKPIIENADAIATALEVVKKLDFPVDTYELRWLRASVHTPSNSIKGMKYTVHVPMSGKTPGLGEPIGVLRPSKIPGTFELTVLPYDFVSLMVLLRQAAETARATAHVQTLAAALSPQWKQEFNAYLYNIPPYYYTPLRRALHRFGITLPGEGRNDGGLTRGLTKKLQRIQEAAMVDIQRVEQARRRGCTLPEDPIIAATRPPSLPTSARDVRPDDLLMQWEAVRKALFGGTGFTVQGLFVKGIPGRGGYCAGADLTEDRTIKEPVTLFASSGAHAMPQRKIRDMSNYTEVLARMEAPRDPESPQPDEDTPQGILRRKLNVHFGNPFRTSKKAGPEDAEAPSSLHIDETAEEVAALFMDTPAPQRDEQLEESAQPAPQQASGREPAAAAGRSTIPPLGKPPARKRKRPLPTGKSEAGEAQARARSGIAVAAPAPAPAPAAAPASPSQQQIQQQQVQEAPASPQSVAESAQLSPGPFEAPQSPVAGPPTQRQRIEKEDVHPMPTPQPMKLTATTTATTASAAAASTASTPAAAGPTVTQVPQPQPPAPQEPPLPPGWVKHFSKREQQYYYFNTNTGESSWVRPT